MRPPRPASSSRRSCELGAESSRILDQREISFESPIDKLVENALDRGRAGVRKGVGADQGCAHAQGRGRACAGRPDVRLHQRAREQPCRVPHQRDGGGRRSPDLRAGGGGTLDAWIAALRGPRRGLWRRRLTGRLPSVVATAAMTRPGYPHVCRRTRPPWTTIKNGGDSSRSSASRRSSVSIVT